MQQDLSELLEMIYREKGWDFRQYKTTSLSRRVLKRLAALKVSSYAEYCEVLKADPSEYNRLFSNITIKVSEFFREHEVFEFLCTAVRESFPDEKGLKIWSCGCAYGEEAYSLAILLTECLSADVLMKTKIFATDIDSEALEQARKALYREESLRNVTPAIRKKYFFMHDGLYKVKYNIRNLVKFGTLDIVRNPSISGVNILFCRNLFIYFNKALQEQVFEKLDYALKPGGLIVLGKAEVLPSVYSSKYTQLGLGTNIYRKNTAI
ncbi:MAG: protein-glutamate O-methyltransferase CheR [Deltaproteobacteria bacterium]|nr:protein-glutamate O-methyltransferase CheR [Deltaproteobacteria bacterium]